MKGNQLPAKGETFSKEQINEQIQKIILDPIFKYCEILKRFLLYVTEQTLAGHADQIKEYTIGVYVLNKPKGYKPEESGIVRIHASRLRRYLHKYYSGSGSGDPIHISIPHGTYVPVFDGNMPVVHSVNIPETTERKINVAVLPFLESSNKSRDSFCDSLCIELSNEIATSKKLQVTAYYIMRNLFDKLNDLKEVASVVEAEYVLTGHLQKGKNKFRINIEMIEVESYKLVWSTMIDRSWMEANSFQLQDEIIKIIISAVEEYFDINSYREKIKVIA